MTTLDSILHYLHYHPAASRAEMMAALPVQASAATVKRLLAGAVRQGQIVVEGKSRASRYSITPRTHLLMTFDTDTYFQKEIDERVVQTSFNFDLLEKLLPGVSLFSEEERRTLDALQRVFTDNVSSLPVDGYNREMERLGIDLSWKSSQIEGNTYSLLETERLLKERKEAEGKSREEAVMLLNHKDALHFLLEEPSYLRELSVGRIEDIHALLVKGLNVERGIRSRRVGITGTNYRPLDNVFQVEEAMRAMCDLVNSRRDIFEKALLALVLISYIQPFSDGNKRTARIVSNAILIANRYCPLSFRTVDSIDYKKAMLVFYEQNNISAVKKIFMEQFAFAVNTYF